MFEILIGFIVLSSIIFIIAFIGAIKEYIYSKYYINKSFLQFLILNSMVECANYYKLSSIRVKTALFLRYLIEGCIILFYTLLYGIIIYAILTACGKLGKGLIELLGVII
ncbi:MAG: hypothetical protein EKK56_07790 [Flavobacteriaceae bacterium]|nr:MAG: hypothetical protein EKK56_07790 [Flavobacteriaceae bacterium]